MSERVAEKLVELLRERVRRIGTVVPDPPRDRERGHWIIDVYAKGRHVRVEYKATMGFGLTLVGEGNDFGEKPDMVFVGMASALDQVDDYLM